MKTTKRRTHALATLTLALTLALAGCASDEDQETAPSQASDHNAQDVAFATQMIQHHAQALAMVDMTMGRDLDPEFQELTEAIREAQGPEIETMSDWLQEWDEEIPPTVRDHVNSHGGDDEGHMGGMDDTGMEMPGMMTQHDMQALEDASDQSFQDMWLTMMIEHHEGAVEMARAEQSDGESGPAIELADAIVESQSDEIDTMRGLLP